MKSVTYLLIFYFALGALMPRCDFGQLSKVNNLFQHYSLHRQSVATEGQELSFFDFLYVHFVEGNQHQHGNPGEHQNLPMHNISSSMTLYHHSTDLVFQKRPVTVTRTDLPLYQNTILAGVRTEIFHPPLFA